jgi:Zn-dependent peptidase ImmA (M78 family)
MPRPWVKRAWTSGIQGLPALAAHFGVSQAAMQVRLDELGLVDRAARCDRPGLLESIDDIVRSAKYQRTAVPLA